MRISHQQDERSPTCGEDSGEVALGDKDREVKEATQALRTSGQTFSREQLDKSNQVREGEEVMSSMWQFSNSSWLNCALETLENLKTFDKSQQQFTTLVCQNLILKLPLCLKEKCQFLQLPLIDV